jgi:glycerophosphoryl diester phosphodiesterase
LVRFNDPLHGWQRVRKINDNLPIPLIIAHRGYSSKYPENTMVAFQAAVTAGAHMIELDVGLSKDRRLIVIHDDTVDRTTNGSGAVSALTLEQLSRLDAGSWFEAEFSTERIPTLNQVLEALKGHLLVNIEIKPEAFEARPPPDAIERQILDLVHATHMAAHVLISSFKWRILERIRILDATIALGLLSEGPGDDRLHRWYQRIGGYSWHPDYRVVTKSQVDALHRLGARVFPYAVDGEIDVCGMLAMHVDGLILDDPLQMQSARHRPG